MSGKAKKGAGAGAGTGEGGAAQMNKLEEVQRQAEDVTNQMRTNIDRAMQRGERIDELDSKAVRLEDNASKFQQGAHKVHWMYRCRNYRNMAIIFFIFAVILVIILWVAGAFKNV